MKEPALVAECVAAMIEVVDIPVTVKCRLGVDDEQDYGRFADFIDGVSAAGCNSFFVHARNAWLKGLSPKENREVPPLRYDWAYRLKQERPEPVSYTHLDVYKRQGQCCAIHQVGWNSFHTVAWHLSLIHI